MKGSCEFDHPDYLTKDGSHGTQKVDISLRWTKSLSGNLDLIARNIELTHVFVRGFSRKNNSILITASIPYAVNE